MLGVLFLSDPGQANRLSQHERHGHASAFGFHLLKPGVAGSDKTMAARERSEGMRHCLTHPADNARY